MLYISLKSHKHSLPRADTSEGNSCVIGDACVRLQRILQNRFQQYVSHYFLGAAVRASFGGSTSLFTFGIGQFF